MEFVWSERKRLLNLRRHGLDFADAPFVFDGLTSTIEDDRFAYYEQRFLTIGLLAGVPVSIIHTETANEARIISRQPSRIDSICIHARSVGSKQALRNSSSRGRLRPRQRRNNSRSSATGAGGFDTSR